MLTKVEIHGLPTDPLELLFGGSVASDPIQIRDIDGLEPVKAIVNTAGLAASRGETYSGTTIGKRNIVFTLGLNPDWSTQTLSELKQLLYRYFISGLELELRFFDDTLPTTKIAGFVETVLPNAFSKDVDAQISIICPQPDFVALTATVITDDLTSAEFVIDNPGTVSSGINLIIERASGSGHTGILRVYNEARNNYYLDINPGTIDATYYLDLNTVPGEKYVWNRPVSAGSIVDLLSAVSGDWPQLDPGENAFTITPDGSNFEYTLTYFQRFGGL